MKPEEQNILEMDLVNITLPNPKAKIFRKMTAYIGGIELAAMEGESEIGLAKRVIELLEQEIRKLKRIYIKNPKLITVCDKCFMASCWHGIFMCQDAQNAGTVGK